MGNDTAQSIIDQIVQSHESGGRAQMFAAPSMRIGAGFMNPMATARELFALSDRRGCGERRMVYKRKMGTMAGMNLLSGCRSMYSHGIITRTIPPFSPDRYLRPSRRES
jgi:hypothetical protein